MRPAAPHSPAAIPDAGDWRDWRWQHRNALRTAEDARAGRRASRDDERRGLARAAGRVAGGGDAVLRVAHGPRAPVLPGPHAGDPGRRRGGGGARATCAIRIGEDAPPARARDRPQVPATASLFLASTAAPSTAATARGGGSPSARRAAFDRDAIEEGLAYVRAHPRGARRHRLGRRPARPLRRAARRAARRAPRDPARPDPPRRDARARSPARCASPPALARDAPAPRAAVRGDPLQPSEGVHARGARRVRARSSTTASRSRTRRCCCAA